MQGGMSRGSGRRLVDRISGGEPPSVDPMTTLSPARHCYVNGSPALLVEWRTAPGGWEGRVISMTWVDAVGWATLERWLPADHITPA